MFSAEKQARLLEQHRQDVAQLRREASIHRIKVYFKITIVSFSLFSFRTKFYAKYSKYFCLK